MQHQPFVKLVTRWDAHDAPWLTLQFVSRLLYLLNLLLCHDSYCQCCCCCFSSSRNLWNGTIWREELTTFHSLARGNLFQVQFVFHRFSEDTSSDVYFFLCHSLSRAHLLITGARWAVRYSWSLVAAWFSPWRDSHTRTAYLAWFAINSRVKMLSSEIETAQQLIFNLVVILMNLVHQVTLNYDCHPFQMRFIIQFIYREYNCLLPMFVLMPSGVHHSCSVPLFSCLIRSSGGGEVAADGDSSWAAGSSMYPSSLPHSALMPSIVGDETANANEWTSRSGHISNPFLEVYDEQQLLEQKKLLRRRLQASKERESMRQSAIRAHDYTDDVTNHANAYDHTPRYRLPSPPGPPKYDDDREPERIPVHPYRGSKPYQSSGHYNRRTSHPSNSDSRDYMEDNPMSASSRMQLKTMKTRARVNDPLSAFTSAEILAAADLLSPPPPLSSRLNSLSNEDADSKRAPGIGEYDTESRMKSHQIESEHKTRGISRRSNKVNSSNGSTLTSNVLKNSLDHPYFASVLRKDKTKITHWSVISDGFEANCFLFLFSLSLLFIIRASSRVRAQVSLNFNNKLTTT